MADNETGDPVATADGADRGPDARAKPNPRWRRILVTVLVVLGCVLAPLSVLGVWVHSTLLDTDRYVSTIGPLADDAAVQDALADRITTAVVTNSGVESKVTDALPKAASFLGPSITKGLDQFVHTIALNVTQSDAFSKLWKEVNRRAHTRLVALLEGKGSDTVATKNGQLSVNLGPAITKVQNALESRGIDAFANANPNRTIVLIDSKDLRKAQGFVDLLDKLAWILPVVTVLLFAAAIVLSRNRRRTILRGALGVALGMGLLLVVFNLARHFYLDALPGSVHQDAAAAVYDQLLSFLRVSLRSAFVVALVVALAAWIAGPGERATRIRAGTLALVRGRERDGEPSAVAVFVSRHRTALRIVVIAIGLAVLVAISAPTPLDVIITAALVIVAILLIEFIGRGITPANTGSTS